MPYYTQSNVLLHEIVFVQKLVVNNNTFNTLFKVKTYKYALKTFKMFLR